MIRVLEAITDTNIGGAGILLVTRLAHMNRQRYDVTVALPKGSLLKKRICSLGVRTVELDGCYDRSLDLGSILKWVALLRKERPSIVNCHGCFSCRIAARICRVPVLMDTRHCAYPPNRFLTRFPGKFLCGLVLNTTSDHTVAVAEAAKENLVAIGRDPERISVIVNGAEAVRSVSNEEQEKIKKIFRIPPDCFVVGMIARLEECKGHTTLLEAAKILKKRGDRYCFLLVGDGSRREHIEKYAKKLEVNDLVLFCGFAEDVAPFYHVMHLNVNCSVGTETSSLALSEGMSLGIPAVASDYGGNPYMVRDGENGFLFPVGNARALADRIQEIRKNPILYKKLSKGAKARFRGELNAERMTRCVEQLYETLLKSRNISKAERRAYR